jgi:protein-tyrosine phosphatase
MNRLVGLTGTRNLRDLGGYPTVDGRLTRWRTVYRSDCLDQLDAAGQTWLIEAGLRTIVDLRGDREVAAQPNVFANSTHVEYRRIPFWDQPPPADFEDPDLTNGYTRELDDCGDTLAAIFSALIEPEALPALIHCAAGKDRTGVVVALLLEAAGVTREAISQDYALSAECLGPENVAQGRIWVAQLGREWERWAHTFDTPPERMLKTLDYLDQHFGGVGPYLLGHGLDAHPLDRLRRLLIADS